MPVLYAKSLDELLNIVNQHEINSCTKFVRRLPSDFTSPVKGCESLRGKRILYLEGGLPGLKLGSTSFVCQYGPDARKKKKEGADNSKNEDVSTSRVSVPTSHKLNCPAKITVFRQVIFHSFATAVCNVSRRARNKKMARSQLLACISSALSEGKVTFQVRYVITLPADEEHVPKHAGKDYDGYQPLDERLRQKVKELVSQLHITQVKVVQKHLEDFVMKELYKDLPPPPKTNQRFYPDLKILRNCVDLVIAGTHFVGVRNSLSSFFLLQPLLITSLFFVSPRAGDQDSLEEVLLQLAPNHRWKLPDRQTSDKFLFVHQTVEQAELMAQHGWEMCELNATHRTTRHVFPMYFIVVKVDTCYQVVGTFIVPQQTRECISEALQVIADWNSSWRPQHWMAGHCAEEISAIEAVFQDTQVYICDFHRVQSWSKWMASAVNAIPRETALTLTTCLKQIAESNTVDELNERMEELHWRCEWIDHVNLQNYMMHTWFGEDILKRWVRLYRTERVLKYVRTTDGVEKMNRLMKAAIKGGRCPPLSSMVPRLLNWLSDLHTKYLHPRRRSHKTARKSSPLEVSSVDIQEDGEPVVPLNSSDPWSSVGFPGRGSPLDDSFPPAEVNSQTVACKSDLMSFNSANFKLKKLRQALSDIHNWSFLPISGSLADAVLKDLLKVKAKIDHHEKLQKFTINESTSNSSVTAKRKKLSLPDKRFPQKKSRQCQ